MVKSYKIGFMNNNEDYFLKTPFMALVWELFRYLYGLSIYLDIGSYSSSNYPDTQVYKNPVNICIF